MGRNAQRRRAAKEQRKAENAHVRYFGGSTRTLHHLRERMRYVDTLAQFEGIIATAHEDHRGTTRKLLEPMLRPDLPCCGPALLAAKIGQNISIGQHSLRCPMRNRVELAE